MHLSEISFVFLSQVRAHVRKLEDRRVENGASSAQFFSLYRVSEREGTGVDGHTRARGGTQASTYVWVWG